MAQVHEGGHGGEVAQRIAAARTLVRLVVTAYLDWALRYRRRYGGAVRRAGRRPAQRGHHAASAGQGAMALLMDMLVAVQDAAPGVARAAVLVWTRVHGIVGLKLTGMLRQPHGQGLAADRPGDRQRRPMPELAGRIPVMTPEFGCRFPDGLVCGLVR
ncbi:TetR-like C-terminal domain-containing protein [Streptomyces mirabilis]|uniref:TetR-like C-terminal domain-containing protein n=1 Tax=Streptomyces mirabilis TaxID=68239 RepID=UPI0037125827